MHIRGVELFVEERGTGEPVLFSHGLLWSGRMFAPQIDALSSRYRCIAYDHRGQGRSGVPAEECITIETVYEDAVALIERLGIAPCHFVGLSMGGFVGMRIAARRPELVRSLSLLATAADPEPRHNLPKYRAMNAVARVGGLRLLTGRVMRIMCGGSFLADQGLAHERRRLEGELVENRRTVYKAVRGVLERDGVEHELGRIRVPTLVMRGLEDKAIARERAERLHAGIAGSSYVQVPRAGHTLTRENPAPVSTALAELLATAG
jgi:pimeloyl-ACP methyl ester carboxylesterase